MSCYGLLRDGRGGGGCWWIVGDGGGGLVGGLSLAIRLVWAAGRMGASGAGVGVGVLWAVVDSC